jgi:sulfite exporter TauE/SafE
MLAFGLGTMPAMMAPGAARALVTRPLGGRLARAAGGLVVAVGLLTIARGIGGPLGGAHVHAHPDHHQAHP